MQLLMLLPNEVVMGDKLVSVNKIRNFSSYDYWCYCFLSY